ncbi:helix-turn-helix domain-containing protein [Nocardia beijingensis]|uniref:helix-turn-helix domain-containing protein n=1 Tax=Nocardia beijingensis TaxID=95162 RepID=UPI0018951B22|nr:helix-turn-helix transcriptional regulator [Nocardia beijingensis]MBF6075300.1 helix-turn-helix transcriptional regulator [Nocardia beijingensis]
MENPGLLLRNARSSRGVSLAALAAKTNYSKSLLGMIENGQRAVKQEHIMGYSRALNIPISVLMAPSPDPIRVAHEWLVADSAPKTHASAGRRVGESLATEMERRVVELRHLDDSIGGGELLPLALREFESVRKVVTECSYTERVGKRLLGVAGELAQLAGWVASDAGRYEDAQHLYLSGAAAADDAGDRVLTAQLLSSLSYQMANVGNPYEAALLARTAVKGATGASPVVRCLLTDRLAWACARSRDRDEAERALDAVDETYERRSPDIPEPEWVYWLDRTEIDVMAGRCFVELDEPRKASSLLSGAIAQLAADRVREVALYRTWLAESYLKTRDLDAARSTIREAKTAAETAHSARLDRRIAQIEGMLA